MILQRYPLGETIFEVPRTKFTYRNGEEKKYREYGQIAVRGTRYAVRGTRYAVRGTFPVVF